MAGNIEALSILGISDFKTSVPKLKELTIQLSAESLKKHVREVLIPKM